MKIATTVEIESQIQPKKAAPNNLLVCSFDMYGLVVLDVHLGV